MWFKALIHKLWNIFKKIAIAFFILSICSVILLRFIPVYFTPLMLVRATEQLFSGKDIFIKKEWKPLEKISDALPLAVIASEDQLFLQHHGFDFESMKKAWKNNTKNKARIKGASTISQQVAKNVFLWQGRSYVRKILEAYFTLLIEVFWDKKRIIEVYLNIAETGEGLFGVEVCAQKNFYKSAKNIKAPQAALIAAILPNPRKWSPQKPSTYIKRRQQWILRNMKNIGEIKWE